MRELVVTKVAFNDPSFTRRELRLMHDLCFTFADEITKPLIGFTYEERGPWTRFGTAARETASVFHTRWRCRILTRTTMRFSSRHASAKVSRPPRRLSDANVWLMKNWID